MKSSKGNHLVSLWASVTAAVVAFYAMPLNSENRGTLQFIPESLDFGIIREDSGKVTRRIKAVNISGEETFIISARTSCGCSAAEYPQQTLAPGDTTEISITYNPLNRPGQFLKTAKIFTGEERIPNIFKLRGNVIPSRENLEKSFPAKAGSLRLSSPFINAGEVGRNEMRPLFVGIYNDSDSTFHIDASSSDTYALDPGLIPDTIPPSGISTLTLMLKGTYISESTSDFNIPAFILDAERGDTIARIPVVGTLKPTSNSK